MKCSRSMGILVCLPGLVCCFGWMNTGAAVRFSIAAGYSDNVFESVFNPAGDGLGRLQLLWQTRTASDKPLSLALTSHSGVEAYGRYGEENRLIENCAARGEWRMLQKLSAGFETRHKFQHFFSVTRGYRSHLFLPFFEARSIAKLSARFVYLIGNFDYRIGSTYDSRMTGFQLSLDWQIAPRLTLAALWKRTGLDYDRFALVSTPAYPYWTSANARQHDQNHEVSLEAEWYCEALFRLGFAWETNRSNSYGFGYDCPKWSLLIARQIVKDWTFSLLFRLQQKNYADRLAPVFQLYPDTESEENNSLFLQLEHDLSSASSLEIKGGWVRNESPFRSRYYKKTFFSIGFARRF